MKAKKITYKYLKKNNLILFEAITGSQAYGTNTPESDEDHKFVYILPEDMIYGMDYIDYVEENKDHNGWEIKRFIELILINNPTAMEFLHSPAECIVHKDPCFDILLKNRSKFISMLCEKAFGGYADTQIKKAKNLNKVLHWKDSKITRKTLLDFVYVIEGGKSISWKKWNKTKGYEEKFCGVTKLAHGRDNYAVYFDSGAYSCFSESLPEEVRELRKAVNKVSGSAMGFGYKGLVKVNDVDDTQESNQLRLSSIPKGEKPVAHIIFNKDGYTEHCKDYNKYQTWLKTHNKQRYVDVKSHGQKIDGKNALHTIRLLDMGLEIGSGMGIQVRRPNAKYLLSIRKGEMDLEQLLASSEGKLQEIHEAFKKSGLPATPDKKLLNECLVKIRKCIYNR